MIIEGELVLDMKLCCQCQKNKAEEFHSCPYESDVFGDKEFECNCCSECEQKCLEDI